MVAVVIISLILVETLFPQSQFNLLKKFTLVSHRLLRIWETEEQMVLCDLATLIVEIMLDLFKLTLMNIKTNIK
jgi:hypothetical protein